VIEREQGCIKIPKEQQKEKELDLSLSPEVMNELASMRFFWEIVPAIKCNFKCLNCYAGDNARPDNRLLSWDEMKMALDRAIHLGIRQVDILGGEPLTYRYLEKFIEYFKSNVHDGFCGVVSNGSLVTKERARSLFNSGLDQLSISLDGTEAEINDANRGRGMFKKALGGIENALDAGIPLTIAYTITPFNTEDTPNLFPFVQELGAKALAVQITEMVGRAKRTLSEINSFNRSEGLKAICRMYYLRPSIYTEVSTRSLFKEFLNHFFNAGLTIPDVRCDGGWETFMVSSGGDLYPCSEYAYFSDGRQKNEGLNLVSTDSDKVTEFVKNRYVKFNDKMRLLEEKQFTSCQECAYRSSCAPCPLVNPPGVVPECEWVKFQTGKLNAKILRSNIKLVREPVVTTDSEISFLVPTQKEPLIVFMSGRDLRQIETLGSVSQVVELFKRGREDDKNVENKVVGFLCKLRSHQIIEIEGFETFLD